MTTFPMDWPEFEGQWQRWLADHREVDWIRPTSRRFAGRNFMADEVMGTFHIVGTDRTHESGRDVEISTFRFPALGDRPYREVRHIGLTFSRGGDMTEAGPVVSSWAELGEALFCSGERYPVNPDDPDEGFDIRHAGPCALHDTEGEDQ